MDLRLEESSVVVVPIPVEWRMRSLTLGSNTRRITASVESLVEGVSFHLKKPGRDSLRLGPIRRDLLIRWTKWSIKMSLGNGKEGLEFGIFESLCPQFTFWTFWRKFLLRILESPKSPAKVDKGMIKIRLWMNLSGCERRRILHIQVGIISKDKFPHFFLKNSLWRSIRFQQVKGMNSHGTKYRWDLNWQVDRAYAKRQCLRNGSNWRQLRKTRKEALDQHFPPVSNLLSSSIEL